MCALGNTRQSNFEKKKSQPIYKQKPKRLMDITTLKKLAECKFRDPLPEAKTQPNKHKYLG